MNPSEYFNQLVQKRQSDRAYLERPVEEEKIGRIIEAARLSPSACNAQPWRFIVVNNAELKNKLADTTSSKVLGINHFTKQAPVHIVLVMEGANFTSNFGSLVKRKHFPLIDIGIAAEHICLAAAAEGLGSCMIGWFDEAAVRKLLTIPKGSRPVLIITIGYPIPNTTREKRRKPFEQVVSYNSYQ